jgi:cellulose synthase/poly-beta-1,6-N-acetylglucosamine synthase-like glycosyltransferase
MWGLGGFISCGVCAIIPFTRQFAIEYSTLFDAILPALERLDFPIPLGGTSNHFRRSDLEAVGAWDPFNVTEDADLGIRLARAGFGTRVMPSTTWEEAPTTLAVWLPQRTRWLKGWMQTWLVHTRRPGALRATLGGMGALGVHAVMGGLVVSALVQPIFLALLAYQAAHGALLATSDGVIETGLVWISWGNLFVGYLVSMTIGVVSVAQRGRFWLAPSALFMPLYWLLISVAAYRALYQLARAPFLWEKTPHGAGRRRARRP